MPSRFKVLKALEENTTSTLQLVRDGHLKSDFVLRRFKTTDAAEIEGLRSLFAQLAVLDSPRLERIIEAAVDEEGFFALMPAPLEGVTLPEMLKRGPLSGTEFEILAGQLLDALEVVHDEAIVHGTLTPECVRIAGVKPAEWQITLGGFGIGFAATGTSEEHQIAAYRCAAPEQWQKSPARRRTDIYSLGCVLYEALSGRPAFQSRTLKELRSKHIGHDLPDLFKMAPHVPRWMCEWVMSLIITDAETRPRKAGVARETFAARDQAPAAPATTPAPPPAVVAAPIVSAPVMLPITQPARNATASTIPIAVGPQVGKPPAPRRPVAVPSAPKPAVRQFSQQPAANPLWKRPGFLIIAAIVIGVIVWLLKPTSPAAKPAAAKPTTQLHDIGVEDAKLRTTRDLGKHKQRYYAQGGFAEVPPFPSAAAKPMMQEKLVVFHRADLGVNTFEGTAGDKPARLGDPVAFWHDLGPLNRSNALAIIPWDAGKRRAKLEEITPNADAFPLRAPRAFVVFGEDSSPVSAMGCLGGSGGAGVPFGDATSSGATLAVLFYQDTKIRNKRSQVIHVNLSDGSFVLATDSEGRANFRIGRSRDSAVELQPKDIATSPLDATVPTLALARWARDGKITARLLNSRGEHTEGTVTIPCPSKPFQNMAVAGDAFWIFRDQDANTVPFYGGIAEIRLYGEALSDTELRSLADEMAAHYFP